MMNERKMNWSKKALEACFRLHSEMLVDDSFCGYEATKDDFDNLYREVHEIVRNELSDEADVVQVCETFYDYQLEITNGDREVCWFL
jgi:hypothetical protein